jgi:membrane protease YdiL (CAAX protease family)
MSPLKKIIVFLLLTFSFSTLSYIPIIRAGTAGVNGGLYVLTLMYSPGLAGIVTQLIATHSLRGMGWRLGKARWLGIAYILPILYALPVYLFTWFSEQGRLYYSHTFYSAARQFPVHSQFVVNIAIFVLANMTVGMLENVIYALGEEIGWRGLLVPELAKITTFTKTALISGIVWAAWHMPIILFADYHSSSTPLWFSVICFTVMIMGGSFAYTWLRLKSGSLWPAVVLHASHNLFIQAIFDQLTLKTRFTPYIIGEFGLGLALTSVIVAYIFWRLHKADQQKRHQMTVPGSAYLQESVG